MDDLFDENVGVDVAVSPQVAWTLLSDVTQIPRWRAHIADVNWLDTPGVGARFAGLSSFLVWRGVRLVCVVTEWEPLTRLRYEVIEGPVRADALWEITSTDSGCRVSTAGDIVGASWSTRLLRPLAKPLYIRETRGELERFRELLEARPSPTSGRP